MDSKIVRIFGVPMDLGQNRRGVDMGPSAIRYAGLQDRLRRLGYEPHDGGNIEAPQMEQMEHPYHGDRAHGRAHHLPQVAQICRRVYEKTSACLQADERVIFLGGDHSISIGTVAAVAERWEVGLLWVDAHADMNTPFTSPSGNIHGMALAALLGDDPQELAAIGQNPTIRAEQVAIVGLRDLDPQERERVLASGIAAHTMREIDEQGMAKIAHRILDRFANVDHIHISLDMDSLDPDIAPGVGTPVPGGCSYREMHLLMEILADSGKVRSLDIVEVNPILDVQNRTANLAVEFMAGLFGQRIL
jgi:arginase